MSLQDIKKNAEFVRQLELKGIAEAKGIEKKAEAQAKMQQASVVEMIINKLPDIAREVSTPLSNIDSITMYGDQSTSLIENNTQKIDKILKFENTSANLSKLSTNNVEKIFALGLIIQSNSELIYS